MTTATHGFKGKIREMVLAMNALRMDSEKPRDINLRQLLAEGYNGRPGGLTPDHLYAELGITRDTRLKELTSDNDTVYLASEIIRDAIRKGIGVAQRELTAELQRRIASFAPVLSEGSGGARWITPENFTDPILRGAVQTVFYPDLVVREVTVGNMTTTMPYFDLSDAALVDSEEGATIEEGTVVYGTKDVKVKKKAKGIKMTYEALEFNTLDLIAVFFEDFGRLLGHGLNGDAVLAILNGDQVNGSEAAAVIGVETAATLAYKDILRVWIRMALLGRMSTSIIGSETTGLDYLLIPEVKDQRNLAGPLAPTTLKVPLPNQQDLYVSAKVPANKIIFQDSSASLVQLTARPLMVETEKIVSKQIQGEFASIITGFAKLNRNASVVVDKSITFAANPFPAWMNVAT